VNVVQGILLGVAVLLLAYLVLAMFKPEWF